MKRPILVINRQPCLYFAWRIERVLSVDDQPYGDTWRHVDLGPMKFRITLDYWNGKQEVWITTAPMMTDTRPRTGRRIYWCDDCMLYESPTRAVFPRRPRLRLEAPT